MTKKFLLATFFAVSFHPAKAQLEYALEPEKREILERDFERLCELDFDADFEFGSKEKWERVVKQAFGMEKVDCLGFKRFIEERLGLVVDHFDSDNLVTINVYGKVKRIEDRNVFFETLLGINVGVIRGMIAEMGIAARLEKILHNVLYNLPNELFLTFFSGRGIAMRNYVYALEYTTNEGEKKMFPIALETSAGVAFLNNDKFFDEDRFNSFQRIAMLIHEARHENRELYHVPCLMNRGRGCDKAPDESNGTEAIFLAYIAGICGDNCDQREKTDLINTALGKFQKINTYQSNDKWALDIHDLMMALLERQQREQNQEREQRQQEREQRQQEREQRRQEWEQRQQEREQRRQEREQRRQEWEQRLDKLSEIINTIEEKEHP